MQCFLVIVQLTHKFLSIYLFIVLYMFRACHAHHQEKQIVSIQLLVNVTPCWWQCRVRQVGQLPRITFSIVTWSVQLISIPLQHQTSISKTFQIYFPKRPQTSAPYWALLQIFFINFFLKFKSSLLVTKKLLLVEHCFCHGNPGCNSTCTSCKICYPGTHIV